MNDRPTMDQRPSGTYHAAGSRVGDYIIEHEIGRGGMGIVYRAHKADTGQVVALKLMLPELGANPEYRERFVQEAKLGPNLEHPNIVPVFDAGEADGELFIAMRLIEGRDLKEMIKQEGPLDPRRVLSILSQAAAALDAAHEAGVVHRDMKPQNILVAFDPESRRDNVYVGDFGLVKPIGSESHASRTGQILGSIQYMSPEVVEGLAADGRADVYSLGCVLYECLTGRIPFDRPNEVAVLWAHVHEDPPRVSNIRPGLPGGLDLVVGNALAKHPEDRFLTCGEFISELERGLERKHRPVLMPIVRPLVTRAPRRKTEREVWAPNYFPELSRVRKLTDKTNWLQVAAVTTILCLLAAALVQFAHPKGISGAVATIGTAVADTAKTFVGGNEPDSATTEGSALALSSGAEGERPPGGLRRPRSAIRPDAMVVPMPAPAGPAEAPPDKLAAPATAASVPGNGRIVFSSDRDVPGNWDLYLTMNGNNLTRLTSGGADEWNPEWSPDGSKILFTGCTWRPFCDLYTIRPDGTELTRLTTDGKSDSGVWSPDGRKIAFAALRSSDGTEDIYVMNADGSGRRRLTHHVGYEDDPSWSPNGKQIAFHRAGDIYVMNADGSRIRPLLATAVYEGFPVWSPTGDELCFESPRDGDFDIWTVSSDGKILKKITKDDRHDPLDDFWCNWSPDGKMLAYTSGANGTGGSGGKIFISNADGSNERLLGLGGISDFDPDWEPVRSES